MLGFIVLSVLLIVELGLLVYSFKANTNQRKVTMIVRFCEFALFIMFAAIGIIQFNFRWIMLFAILFIQSIAGIIFWVKKQEAKRNYTKKRVIMSFVLRCMLFIFAIVPSVIFPQFENIVPSGSFAVSTESLTLIDTNRIETYIEDGDNRRVTVQFWYPDVETDNSKYPLVIFSHGAFGFRGSNYSTFMELASNGYVVCSIDHTYQSFFSSQTDGNVVIVNNNFINDAVAVQNGEYDEEKTYKLSHEWLKLRTEDVNFVLETIIKNDSNESIYDLIDIEKIGLSGHSLGGATAAEVGRLRKDIDAVIVIDGTMIGEQIELVDGKSILNQEAYPVPILNIFNEEHYNEALLNYSNYANMVASENAVDSHNVVFRNSGHLSFTDLPMFSPLLAKMLGTGTIDKMYCIETMNNIVLNYFNYYLKDGSKLNILNEY